MPLSHSYAPAATAVGPVALQAGVGNYQQRQAERGDRLNQMLLGAALQDRSMRGNWAMDMARMQAGQQQAVNNQAMDWNRAVMGAQLGHAQNLAQNQLRQDAQLQEFQLRENLAAAQMQQEKEMKLFELDLSMRPEANKVYQDLQGRRSAIDQARTEGLITDDQHQLAMQAWADEASQFNPKNFQRSNVWGENQQPGMVWTETYDMGNGMTFPIPVTRDANGDVKPLISNPASLLPQAFKEQESKAKIANMERDDKRANEQFRIKQEAEAAKATAAKAKAQADADAAELKQLNAALDAMYDRDYKAHERKHAGAEKQPDFVATEYTFEQAADYLKAQQDALKKIRNRGTESGATNQGGMPMQQPMGGQQPVTPLEQYRSQVPNVPPMEFASYMVQTQPNSVISHLFTKYPKGEEQLRAAGNPDDLALLQALVALKQQR